MNDYNFLYFVAKAIENVKLEILSVISDEDRQ